MLDLEVNLAARLGSMTKRLRDGALRRTTIRQYMAGVRWTVREQLEAGAGRMRLRQDRGDASGTAGVGAGPVDVRARRGPSRPTDRKSVV